MNYAWGLTEVDSQKLDQRRYIAHSLLSWGLSFLMIFFSGSAASISCGVEQSTLVCFARVQISPKNCSRKSVFLGQRPTHSLALWPCRAGQSTLVSWGRAKSPDRDFRAAAGSCCNAQPPNLHTLTFPPPCLAAAQCTCPDPLFFNKVVEIWLFSMKTNTFVRQSRTHLLKWLLNLHKPVTCLINYTKVLPLWRKWKSQPKTYKSFTKLINYRPDW